MCQNDMPLHHLAIAQIPVGESKTFDLYLENLDEVVLARPVEGRVNVALLTPTSALADYQVTGALQLECDRCLKQFDWPFELNFRAHFTTEVDEDSYPLTDQKIEVSEPVRQEIIIATPMQKLCQDSCPGISEN